MDAPEGSNDAALRGFLTRLARYANDWLEDRQLMDEHRRLMDELDSTGDLDALLEAVGATREELNAWAISPLRSEGLLDAMMARVGVRAEEISALVIEDVRRACRCCASWKQCRRWLRDGGAADAYREFCPNATLLDHLAEAARRRTS
ncbi:MAG TPA: DUF6455 family protein [Casimicrobiaceae bacterium]|nr:DUF6455 family protein [Casimicrobiaceae bacterium]